MRDNVPAFPCEWRNEADLNATAPNGEVVPPGGSVMLTGMDERKYIALHMLAAIVGDRSETRWCGPVQLAAKAVEYADALLRELEVREVLRAED